MDDAREGSERIHNWELLRFSHKARRNEYWVCRCCLCGREKTVRLATITKGNSSSCGCRPRVKHGHARSSGKGRSGTFVSWQSMIQRCHNENHIAFQHYGGRGIRVCERWRKSFQAFLDDMGERPKGETLGRIETDADYEPGKCAWQTWAEQGEVRRNAVWIETPNGRMRAKEAAAVSGISAGTLYARHRAGWPPGDMFSPAKPGRRKKPRYDGGEHENRTRG